MELSGDIRWIFAAAGCLLLFGAVFSKGFRIKEIETQPIGRVARYVAGVLGIGLITLAVLVKPYDPSDDNGPQEGINPPIESNLPVVANFQANPDQIRPGEGAVLQWAVEEAASVLIYPGNWSVSLSGQRTVHPVGTTTYTITAQNSRGISNATATVVVTPVAEAAVKAPTIKSFHADSHRIRPGSRTTLFWEVLNADSVKIEPGVGAVSAHGDEIVSPSQTTQYKLSASNDGGTVEAFAEIKVMRPPATQPDLALVGSQPYEVRGTKYIRYNLTIRNWELFSEELFRPAPHLPPCGLNTNASRAWLRIFDASSKEYIYGYCAFKSNQRLEAFSFAIEQGSAIPKLVFVRLIDRETDKKYKSNVVEIR